MIQDTIDAADEAAVIGFLDGWKSGGGAAYGGGGFHCPVGRVYRQFGEVAGRKRLKLLEGRGLVTLSGRGRNRAVRLTPEGKSEARRAVRKRATAADLYDLGGEG